MQQRVSFAFLTIYKLQEVYIYSLFIKIAIFLSNSSSYLGI